MISIIEVNFDDKKHCAAVIKLMNHYMTDEMGGQEPHSEENALKMIQGLKAHSDKYCILAIEDGEYVGLSNCFIGFGTFAAKPFINIHDIIVLKKHRNKGIGRLLLNNIKDKAKSMDCAKVTLEVRDDNKVAQSLYRSIGFQHCNPPMYYWAVYL